MRLPDLDFSLSPITGYTRAHWEAVADGLLAGVRPYFDASGALVRLPGRTSASGPDSDGLEGFARTFLLAAIRVVGAGGHDPDGLLTPYADGLAAGPRGAWLPITDRAQPMVESASIAIALHLTKPWLWDRLDDTTREHLADWLSGALNHQPVDNNWMLFPIPVADFLAAAGVPHDDAAVERGLSRLEDFYVGGGWYRDGERRSFDHYNGWALHLYPNLRLYLSGALHAVPSAPPGPAASSAPNASSLSVGLDSMARLDVSVALSRPSAPSALPRESTSATALPSGASPRPEAALRPEAVARDEVASLPGAARVPQAARVSEVAALPGAARLFGDGADDRYRTRLREFLFGYAEWFGSDGAPLHFGRSLTYRMASAAPLWLGELVGATPLSPGRTRRIASGALRYFLERGAVSDDGLLTSGWHGPHEPTLQWYSGAASPYWASKGFLGLLLPPDHPAWTSEEEEGPDEATRLLPEAGLLVHRHGGIARLINHGSDDIPWTAPPPGDPHPDGDDPLYARLAYSTVTGPTRTGDVPDNHFGLVLNGRLTSRGPITPATVPPDTDTDTGTGTGTGRGRGTEAETKTKTGRETDTGAETEVDAGAEADAEVETEVDAGAETDAEVETDAGAGGGVSISSVHVPRLDGVPVDGARVVSTSRVEGGREVRTHVVWAELGTVVRQTGWALSGGNVDKNTEGLIGLIEIADGDRVSRLNPLCGWSRGGTLDAPHGTAFGARAVVPYLEGTVRESPATFVCEVELHDVRFGENEHKRSAGA